MCPLAIVTVSGVFFTGKQLLKKKQLQILIWVMQAGIVNLVHTGLSYNVFVYLLYLFITNTLIYTFGLNLLSSPQISFSLCKRGIAYCLKSLNFNCDVFSATAQN